MLPLLGDLQLQGLYALLTLFSHDLMVMFLSFQYGQRILLGLRDSTLSSLPELRWTLRFLAGKHLDH